MAGLAVFDVGGDAAVRGWPRAIVGKCYRAVRTWCIRPSINRRLFHLGENATGGAAQLPESQVCRTADFENPNFCKWLDVFRERLRNNRKLWEWCFVPSVLESRGFLTPGSRGLGFAVGREPLAAIFASRGCRITATDLASRDHRAKAWQETGQHAETLAGLNQSGICSPQAFQEQVSFRPVDMNAIPPDLLQGNFDFTWSTCSFEHCGTLELGMEFVRRQMACLRPGGIAVHTTELNLSSNASTIEAGPTVIYRRRDIERLIDTLTHDGHSVAPLDLDLGDRPLDRHVDRAPYDSNRHMRLALYGYVVTSIGLVITKGS